MSAVRFHRAPSGWPGLLAGLSLLIASAPLATQHPAFTLLRADGTRTEGRLESWAAPEGSRAGAILKWRVDQSLIEVPWSEVIALHGRAAESAADTGALAVLVGGDEFRGELLGGDREGEHFVIRSGSLGDVPVAVDRLDVLLFLARAGASDRPRLRVPDSAPFDESFSVRARRGFDTTFGEIHRFESDGLAFAVGGGEAVMVEPYSRMAAIALRKGLAPSRATDTLLQTRSGDRLGVDLVGFRDGVLHVRLETGQDAALPLDEVASITPRQERTMFLSDLDPAAARERSYFREGDETLFPYQRDRSALGMPLRAAGHEFRKGIGVHASSHLAFVVPAQISALTGMVAVDDSVRDLPVRGDAAVQVLVEGKRVFGVDSLTAASGLVPLGRIRVEPGQVVELRVEFGAGLDLGDRIDWLDLAFLR